MKEINGKISIGADDRQHDINFSVQFESIEGLIALAKEIVVANIEAQTAEMFKQKEAKAKAKWFRKIKKPSWVKRPEWTKRGKKAEPAAPAAAPAEASA